MTPAAEARRARLGEHLVQRAHEIADEAEDMGDELKADLAALLRRPPIDRSRRSNAAA